MLKVLGRFSLFGWSRSWECISHLRSLLGGRGNQWCRAPSFSATWLVVETQKRRLRALFFAHGEDRCRGPYAGGARGRAAVSNKLRGSLPSLVGASGTQASGTASRVRALGLGGGPAPGPGVQQPRCILRSITSFVVPTMATKQQGPQSKGLSYRPIEATFNSI